MDFVKKQLNNRMAGQQGQQASQASGGSTDNPMSGTNTSMNQAGANMGAQSGHSQNDMLNKGMSFVQQRMGGQGGQGGGHMNPQAEAALRSGFKSATGRDFPMGKPPGAAGN